MSTIAIRWRRLYKIKLTILCMLVLNFDTKHHQFIGFIIEECFSVSHLTKLQWQLECVMWFYRLQNNFMAMFVFILIDNETVLQSFICRSISKEQNVQQILKYWNSRKIDKKIWATKFCWMEISQNYIDSFNGKTIKLKWCQ